MKKEGRVLKTAIVVMNCAWFIYLYPESILAAPRQKEAHTTTSVSPQWRYKRTIFIKHRVSKVSNAVIPITLTSATFDYTKVKSSGADIRFTAASGKLTGDGLAYWIEQWNEQGETKIWVKVPISPSGTTAIQMQYGNAAAEPVSNGDKTFLFFDDFDVNDYTKKWTNTSIGEVVVQDGFLKLRETDGQDGIITANFDVTGPMIVRTRYQRGGGDEHWVRAGVGGWAKWLCFGDHTDNAATGTNYVMLFDSASLNSLKSAPLVKSANSVITKNWRQVTYWYDGHHLNGKQDNVTIKLPEPNASSKLTLRTLDNDNWDSFDFITVSAYTGPDPTVTLGQQQSN